MSAEARKIFDDAAEQHRAAGRLDDAARAELMREYFCNPAFKTGLEDLVFEATQSGGKQG